MRIISPKNIECFVNYFDKYLLGNYFDDLTNAILSLLGHIIVGNNEAKKILANSKTLIDKIGEIVLDESDNLRVDIAHQSVWFLSNLFKEIADNRSSYLIVTLI